MGMVKRKQRAPRAWSKEDVKNLRNFAKDRLSGPGRNETPPYAGRRCTKGDGAWDQVPVYQPEAS